MRPTTALAMALALTIPALPAGAAQRVPMPSASAVLGTSTAPDRAAQRSLTLEARQLQGAEAIDVAGTAPAGAPVTITLLAVVSTDIPTIVVSRHDVAADVNGRFEAVIPIASAYERGTILRVLATSAPGVAPAQAQVITGAPNAGVSVPMETQH